MSTVRMERFYRTSDKRQTDIILILYGWVLILCNIISLAADVIVFDNSNFQITWGDLGAIMMILAGIAILANPKRTVLSTVGVSAIAIAIGKFPTDIGYMTMVEKGLGISSNVMFIVGAVCLGLAVNLLYTGIMYHVGVCRGYFWHMVSISLIALLDFFVAMIMVIPSCHSGDYVRALQICAVYVPILVIYAFYIYLLNDDAVCNSLQIEKVHDRLTHISTTVVPEYDTAILRSDVKLLLDGPGSWGTSEVSGPVESEVILKLAHAHSDSYCIVQKWHGDDRLFFTITDDTSGTIIEAARFSAVRILTDTGDLKTSTKVIFYDRDGMDRVLPICDSIEAMS